MDAALELPTPFFHYHGPVITWGLARFNVLAMLLASHPSFLLVSSSSPSFMHKQHVRKSNTLGDPHALYLAHNWLLWHLLLKRTAYGYEDSSSVHYPLLGSSLLSSKDLDPSSLIFGYGKTINGTTIRRTWSNTALSGIVNHACI